MSVVLKNLANRTSSQNVHHPRNTPQVYWVIFDEEKYKSKAQQIRELIQKNNNHISQPNATVKEKTCAQSKQILLQTLNCYTESKLKITKILKSISEQYATYRFFNQLESQPTKQSIQRINAQIQEQFKKYKLTKRNLVCAVLLPSSFQRLILSKTPYFAKIIKYYIQQNQYEIKTEQSTKEQSLNDTASKKLAISRKLRVVVGNIIFISLMKTQEQIQNQLIKQMKLDFIWLGVMSRLGTDVRKFQSAIIEQQDFMPQTIGFYDQFFIQLDLLLQHIQKNQLQKGGQRQTMNEETLMKLLLISMEKTNLRNVQISASTEQLIRQKFNSRVLLIDIVDSGDYLALLLSRNYFNLLYIENNTLLRYRHFLQQCSLKYNNIRKVLTLQLFLVIDDYWYRSFILKNLPNAKFIIDRGDPNVPYSQIIAKNYKQIIPSYRPNFDEYFISICCLKQAVGSIIVKEKRIISTGYNGTPIDCLNCFNGGCKVCNNSQKMNTQVLSCTCIHAEYGCILQAGIKITPGSTLYSTKLPCLWCCKLIIQGRISKIVYLKSRYQPLEYENFRMAKTMLQKSKIELVQMDESQIYISV